MKILKIHINAFGKLVNYDYDFNENLTVIKEDNSFGKTTIAQFIKAMFFGLKQKVGDDLKYERNRYRPWGETRFGGNLTFNYNGRDYKVTRTFTDSLSDGTLEVRDLTRNVKIDELNGMKITKNNFGDIIFGVNMDSFEKLNFIEQLQVLYSDNNNKIHHDIDRELRALYGQTNEDNDYKSADKALNEVALDLSAKSQRKGSSYNKKAARLSEVDMQIFEAETAAALINKNNQDIKALEEERVKLEGERLTIDKDLKLIADKKLLEKEKNDYEHLEQQKEALETNIKENKKIFLGQNIKDINLDYLAQLSANLTEKEQQFNTFKDKAQTAINELSAKLSKLKDANVEAVIIKRNQKETAEKVDKLRAQINDQESKIKKIGALAIFLSIITFSIYFFVIRSKNKKIEREINALNKELTELNLKLERYNDELSNAENSKKQNEIEQQINELTESVKRKADELKAVESKTFSVFSKFSVTLNSPNDISVAYYKIKTHFDNHIKLTRELDDLNAKIALIDIEKLNTALLNFAELDESQLLNAKKAADARSDDLIREITALNKDNEVKGEFADKLQDYEAERDELRETLANYAENHRLLEETQFLLKKAYEDFAARYLLPVADRVNNMIKEMKLEDYRVSFGGDSSMNVKDKDNNEYYNFKYYSAGMKDFFSVLVRVALIDIVYEDIKPFIIFDDSFVNFDDKRIKLVGPLLEKLAENHQIIYFTCSESRDLSNKN